MKRLEFIEPYLTWNRGDRQLFENEEYADSLILTGKARQIDDEPEAITPPKTHRRTR